jgi:MFS family permease
MDELLRALGKDKLWVMILVFFCWMCGNAMMMPHLVPVAIDYFASQALGHSVQCHDYERKYLPEECMEGASANMSWLAGVSFFANAVLGLTLVPLCGWLSDTYGRKPFFLLGKLDFSN